jgi:HSP20 family protein
MITMTNITRWNPFGFAAEPFAGTLSLRNAIDRLFADAVVRPSEVMTWGLGTNGQSGLAVDVYETDENVVVTAALPGVKPEDVVVSVQGDLLTFRADSKTEEEQTRGSYHLRERRYGSFFRQLQLPVPVKTEGANARFDNGILTLTLPKKEEAREHRIQITAGSGSEKAKASRAA